MRSLIQSLYNRTIRRRLPTAVAVSNGIAVPNRRLLDLSHWHNPDAEEGSVELLKSNVRPTDDVVILGGGYGVTTVWAARLGRHVTAYEASGYRLGILEKTVEVNQVADSVELHHALVGEAVNVAGEARDARSVPPGELPDCDVLEVDIDGAELGVLESISVRPRVVIVEYHENLGTDESQITDVLSDAGYSLVDHVVVNPEAGIGNLAYEHSTVGDDDADGGDRS